MKFRLVRTGDLKTEPASDEEVTGLIESGAAQLADAKNTDLSLESRLPFCSQRCTCSVSGGVANRGCRSENRSLAFQCLQDTLDLPKEKCRVLDQAHRKRNIAEYEGAFDVEEKLVKALIRVTEEVVVRVCALRLGMRLAVTLN